MKNDIPFNVMIDLETLGVTPETVVLTIGMVKFNPNSLDEPFDAVHIKIDPKEQKSSGRLINKETLEWWSKQDPEIRNDAFGPEGQLSVLEALEQIQDYFKVLDSSDHNQGPIYIKNVWGQGYGFDMTILKNLFNQYDLREPWKFFQERDARTLFQLLPEDPRPQEAKETLHNAMSDAYYQAIGVQKALQDLRVRLL